MTTKRQVRWHHLVATLAVALVATACAGTAQTTTSAPAGGSTTTTGPAATPETTQPVVAEPTSVRIAADGFLLGSQAWVSLDKGYFTEENLEVEVSMFGTGIEAIQAVIARQADLGPALDFAVLNLAAAADENMRIVGAVAAPLPGFHSLAVRSDITGPADLVGKKIGYVQGTSEHFVTIRYLEQNGIALDDVELVALPGLFELVGALRTGDIQAAWVWLTGTAEAKDDPNLAILTNDADVLDTVGIYLVAGAEWANANQDTIVRVLRAFDKASADLENDPVGTAEIIAKAVSGDAELFANIIPNQHYQVGLTPVMLDSLDSIAQFLIESGKLPADFDVRDFMDLEAMEEAVPGSVTADLGS